LFRKKSIAIGQGERRRRPIDPSYAVCIYAVMSEKNDLEDAVVAIIAVESLRES